MATRPCPVQSHLLDDLLETSASHYHHCVAVIQRIFAQTYFERLREPAASARFRAHYLRILKQMLREKQAELIEEQRRLWQERDRKIRTYVAARAA